MDTGPLVALLVAEDSHHAWAVEQARHAPLFMRTCEAVLTESLFLVRRHGHDPEEFFSLLDTGPVHCDFNYRDERREVRGLMQRYRDQPMSFADACLVRMAELDPEASIWTLDRDFRHYRRHGRHTLPLVTPW